MTLYLNACPCQKSESQWNSPQLVFGLIWGFRMCATRKQRAQGVFFGLGLSSFGTSEQGGLGQEGWHPAVELAQHIGRYGLLFGRAESTFQGFRTFRI